uniref:Uncharacterized protein n=1 Tax=viral metagenome TaxID=1070528 RepID=A0A6C0IDA8_9ZZZZ
MNFKLVSKNNLGVVTSLLLVILLSQTKILNFLFDSSLGRTILILFIILIAYTNKFLGILIVFFVVVLFNNDNNGYEGFTNTSSTEKNNGIKNKKQQTSGSPTSSTNVPLISKPQSSHTESTSTPSTGGIEGFDIIGIENTMIRGKQSKTIPIDNTLNSSINTEPFNGLYSDSYSQF